MAERLNTFTEPSDDVQGAGSSVTFRRLSYAASRTIRLAREAGHVLTVAEDDQETRRLLSESIVAWNWIDDDGQAFSVPGADATVLERLSQIEVNWLIAHLFGQAQAKN